MRFGSAHDSGFSADALFETYRDELCAFAPRLSGVRAVRRVSSQEDGDVLELAHRWSGDPRALPGPLRVCVPSWLFAWEDRTRWDRARRVAEWHVTVPSLGSMVRMEGRHAFTPRGSGCHVEVEGQLHVALVETFGGEAANDFVRRLLTDILRSSHEVVDAYMAERTQAA